MFSGADFGKAAAQYTSMDVSLELHGQGVQTLARGARLQVSGLLEVTAGVMSQRATLLLIS